MTKRSRTSGDEALHTSRIANRRSRVAGDRYLQQEHQHLIRVVQIVGANWCVGIGCSVGRTSSLR